MKVYFKQEKLRYAKKSSLILRFVYKEYIFRIFALIEIPHKKFNRVKYLLRNYKRLKFTLDVFDYYENFNDFNVIIENDNMMKYIVNNSDKRVGPPGIKIKEEWIQEIIMTM